MILQYANLRPNYIANISPLKKRSQYMANKILTRQTIAKSKHSQQTANTQPIYGQSK